MAEATTVTGAWVRRFHPADTARARLVCFPHAGGSASYYFPVSRALSPRLDVLAVQYPGRQDRRSERCLTDVRDLADAVAAELLPWCDRPTALFGHSLGATVAFEVALRLQEAGTAPLMLFASGRRAPSLPREGERVHLSCDDELVATLRRMSGTNAAVLADEELMHSLLPAVRGDYRAAETYRYRPGPSLVCPIQVLNGEADEEVTAEEARGWSRHSVAGCTLSWFTGGHFYLTDNAPEVIRLLEDEIGKLLPRG
ncbi:thioesterase II family protein [Streptomyces meridianus]|uniref:Alpha/beta fold hydrolase n=1 Tax=Streptomyces meridianus TaxID=2938945 RepID=A0ABT0X3H1_9ACTN|nr:alpha/beta fold hydrolase [Streptomyces meridianus]MCM2576364.1 alpha/beta fold hydrolase [Streptomyces meridianus]